MLGASGFALLGALAFYARLPARGVWALAVLWWAFLLVISAPHLAPAGLAGLAAPGFWFWLIMGPLAALVALYTRLLRGLRARGHARLAAQTPQAAAVFSPAEVDRYRRHIMLREIGGAGQQRLKHARVLVVGAGGLGAPVLLYLAGAGVGVIGVIDDDTVDPSNLQRQIIHKDADLGRPKVISAAEEMRALNPFVEIRPYQRRLEAENGAAILADYDLVIDGCDNFATRQLVNALCVAAGKPLISGAITQWEGQVSLFHPKGGAPCYACVFPHAPAAGLAPNCAEGGVAAPLPGVIGSIMAVEAVKYLTAAGENLRGRLLIWDALYAETRVMRIKRQADCPVCGTGHAEMKGNRP